jgi:hypothetical protein
LHGLIRVEPVLEHSVALALRPATARSVETANSPAPDARGLIWSFGFASFTTDSMKLAGALVIGTDAIFNGWAEH